MPGNFLPVDRHTIGRAKILNKKFTALLNNRSVLSRHSRIEQHQDIVRSASDGDFGLIKIFLMPDICSFLHCQ